MYTRLLLLTILKWTLHANVSLLLHEERMNDEWWTINWNNDNVRLYEKRCNSFYYLLFINFKNVAWWFFFLFKSQIWSISHHCDESLSRYIFLYIPFIFIHIQLNLYNLWNKFFRPVFIPDISMWLTLLFYNYHDCEGDIAR